MEEKDRSSQGLLLFLLGAAAGVAAGLLMAPRSGKETRRRLGRWLEDWEDKGEGMIESGRELYEKGKETVREETDKLKKNVESVIHKAQEKFL